MTITAEIAALTSATSTSPRPKRIERAPGAPLWRLKQGPRETIQEAMARAKGMPWARQVRGEPRLVRGYWCWAGRA